VGGEISHRPDFDFKIIAALKYVDKDEEDFL